MPKDELLTVEEMIEEMEKRSCNILKRFAKYSVSGVNHPLLLSILRDVQAYWKDNFRPALASFSCEVVGGQQKDADDVSLMITLLGAGLGIHDDIIDKSLDKHFRRTILGIHGIDNALLVGELYIVKALTAVREIIKKNFSIDTILSIIDEFETFFIEVWEGEFMETLCRRNLNIDLEYYEKVLWMSTADTEACSRFGAILGGGSNSEIQALAEVGRRLGFLHRLTDDIKDSLNLEGNLSYRLENESIPLPILFASKSSNEIYSQIFEIIEKPSINQKDILLLFKVCLESEAFNYVRSLAKKHRAKVLIALNLIKKSEAKRALLSMLEVIYSVIENLCECARLSSTKLD